MIGFVQSAESSAASACSGPDLRFEVFGKARDLLPISGNRKLDARIGDN